MFNNSLFVEKDQISVSQTPPAGDEDGVCTGACLFNNKVTRKRFVTLIDKSTGRAVILDNNKIRLRRLQKRIKDWVDLLKGTPGRWVMYSLTYKPGFYQRPNDIRDFMVKVRRSYKDRLLGYALVAENQKRGAIHYHVVLKLKNKTWAKCPDKAGWWSLGSSTVTSCRSPYYLVRYTGKEHQKEFDNFPKGIRAFSTWIRDRELALRHRYNGLKAWMRAIVDGEGWQALPFFKDLEKHVNTWVCWGFSETLDGAIGKLGPYAGIYGITELSMPRGSPI